MFQMTVLHHIPADAAAFDEHFRSVHIPLGQKLPGLRRFTVSWPATPDGSTPPYHVASILEWDDVESYRACLASPEGQAVLADIPNFGTAGTTLLAGEAEVL